MNKSFVLAILLSCSTVSLADETPWRTSIIADMHDSMEVQTEELLDQMKLDLQELNDQLAIDQVVIMSPELAKNKLKNVDCNIVNCSAE